MLEILSKNVSLQLIFLLATVICLYNNISVSHAVSLRASAGRVAGPSSEAKEYIFQFAQTGREGDGYICYSPEDHVVLNRAYQQYVSGGKRDEHKKCLIANDYGTYEIIFESSHGRNEGEQVNVTTDADRHKKRSVRWAEKRVFAYKKTDQEILEADNGKEWMKYSAEDNLKLSFAYDVFLDCKHDDKCQLTNHEVAFNVVDTRGSVLADNRGRPLFLQTNRRDPSRRRLVRIFENSAEGKSASSGANAAGQPQRAARAARAAGGGAAEMRDVGGGMCDAAAAGGSAELGGAGMFGGMVAAADGAAAAGWGHAAAACNVAGAAIGGEQPKQKPDDDMLVTWGLRKGVPLSDVKGVNNQGEGSILPYQYFGKDIDGAGPPQDGDQFRKHTLLHTLDRIQLASAEANFHKQAAINLTHWQQQRHAPPRYDGPPEVRLFRGDWGDVTKHLTQTYGETFAVLNMANAYGLGGGYERGMAAQEENMWRRSDCHWSYTHDDPKINGRHGRGNYAECATDEIRSKNGYCYLDVDHPRVCITGPENVAEYAEKNYKTSYLPLADDQIFPFFELRSAAPDLRGRGGQPDLPFNDVAKANMKSRIRSQLATLRLKGVRNVVLSAFGCGAFRNPADEVAKIYKSEIEKDYRRNGRHFGMIAFAIFHAGYGEDNFAAFHEVFGTNPKLEWNWQR